MSTEWTDRRLARLYEEHNATYWGGDLPSFTPAVGEVEGGCLGICYFDDRRVVIDAAAHEKDDDVEDTLLHEMCHVAAGPGPNGGHHSGFFEQLERLLSIGASVSVGFAESGGVKHLEMIPDRFPLCRQKFKHEADGYQIDVARRCVDAPTVMLTLEVIAEDFYRAGVEGLTWETALIIVGREDMLTDIDNAPLPFFAEWLTEGVIQQRHAEGLADRRQDIETLASCPIVAEGYAVVFEVLIEYAVARIHPIESRTENGAAVLAAAEEELQLPVSSELASRILDSRLAGLDEGWRRFAVQQLTTPEWRLTIR